MPNKNKEKFDRYEAKLLKDGHQVFNAQRFLVNNEHIPYKEAILQLLYESSKCDSIALIDGWLSSDRIRRYIIQWISLKMPILKAENLAELPKYDSVDVIYKFPKDEDTCNRENTKKS